MDRSDDDLVQAASAGDTEAFNQLVLRWERTIHALAFRVLGREDDARDVTQEAFLRAYRSLPRFKGEAKFSSWLYRIALNLCRDWLRKQRRRQDHPAPDGFEPFEQTVVDPINETAEDLIVRRSLGEAVAKLMAELPVEQRTAIILKEYHGLTFREIAELVDCPLSTVKTRLYQGLGVLRRRLDETGRGRSLDARRPPRRWATATRKR